MAAAIAPGTARIDHRGNLRLIISRADFRRLLTVRLLSQLGDGWFQAGLAGSILFSPEKNATPLEIAVAFMILLVPYSALGPFVGVFLDRWSRRTVLFVANSSRAVLVLAAAVVIWRGGSTGLPFILLALACIAINRFVLAGISAAQPHVVYPGQLVTANALATTLGTVCYAIGLASVATVLRHTGVGDHAYGLAAASAALAYAGSALIARASFAVGALGPDEAERAKGSIMRDTVATVRGMIAGVRHLASRRGAVALVGAQAGHRALYGGLALDTLLLYRNYFNGDTHFAASMTGIGQAVAASGIGALVASLITPPITRRIGGWRWVAGMLGALAVAVPALGLPYRPGLLLLAILLVGTAAQGTKIVTDTALQLECADEYRGRVFSCNDTAVNLSFVLGIFLGALWLPERGHSPAVLVAIGVGYGLLAVWYAMVAGRYARRVGDDIQLAATPQGPPTGAAPH
jgi:Major Facilitator Superfamily